MKTSSPYTRNKKRPAKSGRISTFFPSFIGLVLRGNDLLVCEATKRFSTRFKLRIVKEFLTQEPSVLSANLKGLKVQGKPIILSWPRERTSVRELYINKKQNLMELRDTLTLQLDSFFPFKPSEAYFDLYPCTSRREGETSALDRKVYLFAVNKRELDAVIYRLEVMGLTPSRIVPSPLVLLPLLEKRTEKVVSIHRRVEGGYVYNFYNTTGLAKTCICNDNAELRLNLEEDSPSSLLSIRFENERLPQAILDGLPEDTLVTYLDHSWESKGAALYETYNHTYDLYLRKPTKRGGNYQNLYLITLLALLVSLVFAISQIAQVKKRERLSLVEAEIERIKERAFALKKWEDLTRAKKALGEVLQARKGYVPRVEVLSELSNLLPEDTWIKKLSLKEGTFELEGIASSLAETMFLLEDSPIFSNIELISPVQKDKEGRDNFRLKGNILREEAHEGF